MHTRHNATDGGKVAAGSESRETSKTNVLHIFQELVGLYAYQLMTHTPDNQSLSQGTVGQSRKETKSL